MYMGNLEIKVYQVRCGDCTYIRYNDDEFEINIFVDAGYSDTYSKTYRNDVLEILKRGKKIDLFIVTHIDQDHISGLKPFLKEFGIDLINSFWFNHAEKFDYPANKQEFKISTKQGISLRDYAHKNSKVFIEIVAPAVFYLAKDVKITILSPNQKSLNDFKEKWIRNERQIEYAISSSKNDYDKDFDELLLNKIYEDDDVTNGSSIAFLLSVSEFNCLFSADAHPSILVESLNNLGYSKEKPLRLDIFKVPHHGSRRNLTQELLELIDCKRFVFSANGSKLPNKETVARIVNRAEQAEKIELIYNYGNSQIRGITKPHEEEKYNFCSYFVKEKSNHLNIKYNGRILEIK